MDNQVLPEVKTEVDEILPVGKKRVTSPKLEDIFDSFSGEVLKVIEKASEIAKKSESAEISAWHLLLALLESYEDTFGEEKDKLQKLKEKAKENLSTKQGYKGVVYFSKSLREILLGAYFISRQQFVSVGIKEIFSALSVHPDTEEDFNSIGVIPDSGNSFYMSKSMSLYAHDLSNFASKFEKTYPERQKELENVIRILARENKNNIILLGDEGVGKSVIGNALASFLKINHFPNFENTRVISLDVGNLFSVSTDFSEDLQNIVESVASMGKIIFFVDNANLLSSDMQVSRLVDFLRTLEKKGNIQIILPIIPSFYKEYISTNPYFSAMFEIIKIDELSQSATLGIIKSDAERIAKYYKLTIDGNIFDEVTVLSARYLSGSLPQKAITLLEEVCAAVSLKKGARVTINDVRDIVSQKTGIPLNSITVSESEKLKNLEILLGKYVIGQQEAITKVSEALRRARAGLKDQKKPIGSFLFLGPTGVGKTELAKTLARLFFNDDKSFLRFDMSEYAESHTAQRLIGSPPGYVGYEEGGQLTNQVIAKPYSLILFDEIEKAHPRVFDLFLQILDEGRLTDAQGRLVDFRNTLIIFTSNIASKEIFDHGKELVSPNFDRKEFFDTIVMPIVREYFRPEFINRFDDIVMFNPLSQKDMLSIAKIKIEALKDKLKVKNIGFEISDEKITELVRSSYDPSLGARPIERAIKDKIENPLARKIISGEIKEGETIKW